MAGYDCVVVRSVSSDEVNIYALVAYTKRSPNTFANWKADITNQEKKRGGERHWPGVHANTA